MSPGGIRVGPQKLPPLEGVGGEPVKRPAEGGPPSARNRQLAVPERTNVNRILVIDDDPSVRHIVRATSSFVDLEVLEAETAGEGLSSARCHAPELVICDLNLGESRGWDVLEGMSDAAMATIPVILITGDDDGATMRRGMDLGRRFLTKPFTRIRCWLRCRRGCGSAEPSSSRQTEMAAAGVVGGDGGHGGDRGRADAAHSVHEPDGAAGDGIGSGP